MAKFDVQDVFEQTVLDGLRDPDPLIRQRNALRVPTDAHTGPAVRAELARLAAEDPADMVRTACADAVAFLEADPAAIAARLAAASEAGRLERMRRWVRARFTVLVPAPAMGAGAWPYFGPMPESVGTTGVPPTAALEGDRISFGRLPAEFEGARLRVLILTAAEGGWHESQEPVAGGAAVVTLPHVAADTRDIGDIWVEPTPSKRR